MMQWLYFILGAVFAVLLLAARDSAVSDALNFYFGG
jgi:hypothetical protein